VKNLHRFDGFLVGLVMSGRKLLILGIVAALMVALAIVQQSLIERAPSKKTYEGAYLIQGLEPANIASIVIGKGEDPIRLVREDNRFVVGNKDNYPAVMSKINNLITSCLDIRTMEWITSNPANHESLHVTEEKAQNVVRFLDGDGQVITGVVIGTSRLPDLQMSKRSTYVRLISSDAVYEALDVPLPQGNCEC
jgi:hypothetical protein